MGARTIVQLPEVIQNQQVKAVVGSPGVEPGSMASEAIILSIVL